jgi:hypothetical protein
MSSAALGGRSRSSQAATSSEDAGVVEGRRSTLQDRTVALSGADDHLPPTVGAADVHARQLQRQHLAETRFLWCHERDVAPGLQIEPVQRRLEGKAAPVDRRRQRQHRGLERFAEGAVFLDGGIDLRHGL